MIPAFGENFIINFLGDSITEGCGASNSEFRFSTIASQILGVKEHNYGIGGTRIAPQYSVSDNPRHDLDFIFRLQKMTPNCDLVVVFGGTNDFGHGDAPFGEQTDKTDKTFCGAVYTLFKSLREKYPVQPIVIILPLHRREEDNPHKSVKIKGESKLLIDYRKEIQRQAQDFGFYILDLWNEQRLNPHLDDGKDNFGDMLHPNDSGYRILGEKVADFIKPILNKN